MQLLALTQVLPQLGLVELPLLAARVDLLADLERDLLQLQQRDSVRY